MGKDARPAVDCFMPLYVGDFIRSTVGWTAAEKGHYLTLLMLQWDSGGLKPELSDLERLSPGISDVWALLETKFPIGKDGLRRNARCAEHHAAAIETRKKRVLAGKKGGRPEKPGLSRAKAGLNPALSNAKAGPKQPEPEPEPQSSSLRSEEIQPAAPVAPTETRKPRSRSQPTDSIRWTPAAGWEGITAEDRAAWATAYPACDVARELAAAGEWLRANPEKAHKSRWRSFLVRWLSRSQDRGGGKPSNRPGDHPPAKAWAERASWRDDACRNLTDAQYREWRRTQKRSQEPQGAVRGVAVPPADSVDPF